MVDTTTPRPTVVRPMNAEERRQREHELSEALLAVRHAQARLEMLGDRRDEVRDLVLLRNELAYELVELGDGTEVPCKS